MIKMDMIWVATAKLIYPEIACSYLVSQKAIEQEVSRLFGVRITPVMLKKHLVSWEDRQADRTIPARGGSRNRYLFRTSDGLSPSPDGDLRLCKKIDSKYDGIDKTGRTCPEPDRIPEEYHYLIKWYESEYLTADTS